MTDTIAAQPVQGAPDDRESAPSAVTWLFGATALVGAGLLFIVQPMVAKLVLPSYGGSATVWSTSSLFFQVLLLGGYVYTHLTTTRLSRRVQPRVHLVVLAVPLLVLPIALPGSAVPGADTSPTLWLLRTLAVMIGLPFIVVCTTGPLLQRWYSWTDGKRAEDPYFLFAASNLGSFGGLLAYPFLIEPHLSLAQQRTMWSFGFVAFAVLMATCGWVASRNRSPVAPADEPRPTQASPVGARRIAYWTALAFLPSTLMLAVTAHLSTDVAPIPLLWVVPLAVYLATFVIAFARTSRSAPVIVTRLAVATAVVATVLAPGSGSLPIALLVGVNLLVLTLAAYAAHARLAADRPEPAHLTLFYLVIAAGGALGGIVNGLVAPVVFDRVWEYPLVLVSIPLLLIGLQSYPDNWFTRRYHPAFVTFAVAGLSLVAYQAASATVDGPALVRATVVLALVALGWAVSRHPVALAVSLALAFAVTTVRDAGDTVERTRTFYGSYAIKESDGQHLFVHGNTVHGTQYLDERRTEPTTYYRSAGPLGDVFGARAYDEVGVIGLGTGTIAAWGVPDQTMTFFEIDPEVATVAQDPSLFRYLSDSEADIEVVEGDGRLLIEESGTFDLVVLDAFNSDSIPVHLLTSEAMARYAAHLEDDGVLAVHISNRVFDLEPVLAAAADDLGWTAAVGRKGGSWWVVLSPDPQLVDSLLEEDGWARVDGSEQVHWSDDYSSILDVLRR